MVPATQQYEVGELCAAATSPVPEVRTLTEPRSGARKAAAAVAVVQRPSERGRDRAGTRSDLPDTPIATVSHHHTARVTRQTPRRFRGNAPAVLESGLARCI